MLKSYDMMQRITACIALILLLYSIPRLTYILDVRYDAVVIRRLSQDEFVHRQWHQQHLDKNKPKAVKAGAAFLTALVLILTLIPGKRERTKVK